MVEVTEKMRDAFYGIAEVKDTGAIRHLDEALAAVLEAALASPAEVVETPPTESHLRGDTIELTAAEVNALLFNMPKDLRLQTTAKMALWLEERPFTDLATTEGSKP